MNKIMMLALLSCAVPFTLQAMEAAKDTEEEASVYRNILPWEKPICRDAIRFQNVLRSPEPATCFGGQESLVRLGLAGQDGVEDPRPLLIPSARVPSGEIVIVSPPTSLQESIILEQDIAALQQQIIAARAEQRVLMDQYQILAQNRQPTALQQSLTEELKARQNARKGGKPQRPPKKAKS